MEQNRFPALLTFKMRIKQKSARYLLAEILALQISDFYNI